MPELSTVPPLNLGQPAQSSPSLVISTPKLDPTYVRATPGRQLLSQSPTVQDPTKPWKDLEYGSQLPVVPVFIPAIWDNAAPCWGFAKGFTSSELNVYNGPRSTPILNVTANTLSPTINMGVNHLDVSVHISDFSAQCDINIYEVDPVNGNVLMKSWVGVGRFTGVLYIGGRDQIVLHGSTVVFEIKNISNGATVTVDIEGH